MATKQEKGCIHVRPSMDNKTDWYVDQYAPDGEWKLSRGPLTYRDARKFRRQLGRNPSPAKARLAFAGLPDRGVRVTTR